MSTWLEPSDTSIPENVAAAVGGHPLVAQALVRRGVKDAAAARAFLDPGAYTPTPASQLPGIDDASQRLLSAIQREEIICVWGDFDVDGQTSTTLLVSAIRELGGQVIYHIPLRATESHGVNLPALEQILSRSGRDRPQLLLTCDTGISAGESLAYAREQGVDVIVTDHHDLPASLPEALAIINPKMLPRGHPLGTLPGVGVAYKLVEDLYSRKGKAEALDSQLDLLALGIVADLAQLYGDARYLLQRGLAQLRRTSRLGLQAMMEMAELDPSGLTEEHIAFVLAPRLNALGRLSDANSAVELLTTRDLSRSRILALELEGLNARRKLLTDQVYQAALAQIDQEPALLEEAALVLAHPAWPAGVLGIVASRLVERLHKPVVLLASPAGELARGSARSIEGVDISAAISAANSPTDGAANSLSDGTANSTKENLLSGFGGHPMAAGLSLDPQRIPEFRLALSRAVRAQLGELPPRPPLQIDGYLELADLTLDLVVDLERLAPFGPGNPPLLLASRGLQLLSHASVGRENEHLLLTVQDERGETRRVIWWQGGGEQLPQGRFDLAYTARSSNYRGLRDVQVEWVEARLIEQPAPEIDAWIPPAEILDYRSESEPMRMLQSVVSQPGVQVWSEVLQPDPIGGRDRRHLVSEPVLAVWTIPPGNAELRSALQAANPGKVVLFAIDPGMDSANAFITRLTGLVKYALRSNQGQVSLNALAAATAQRISTIRAGLAWLEARGHIRFTIPEGDTAVIAQANGETQAGLAESAVLLDALLEETAAYRHYYLRADKDALIGSSKSDR